MFPLTHVFVAQSLLKSTHHQVVLGGIFPDLGNIIGLNRSITHEMGAGFFGLCRDKYPQFLDFARAIITHCSYPHGLDYYADEGFEDRDTGYCFQRGAPFVDEVIKACALPPQMGLWKAHNFIEMAYEVISVKHYPFLTELLQDTLVDDAVITECSDLLGKYFNIDTSKITTIIKNMPSIFCISEVTPGNLAKKYAFFLKQRHGISQADPVAMAGIIRQAQESVEGEFHGFIDSCLAKIRVLLGKFDADQGGCQV
jgi:hypothetical protein